MKVGEIKKYLEELAPKGAAWDKDNVGLQVGRLSRDVTNILLALEINKDVIDQAINSKCNLIITHHPLIFRPINSLDFENDDKSEIIRRLIKNDISLYSAHTNYDFIKEGVSFQLANKLGLSNIKFLAKQESNQVKISVFLPEENVSDVSQALFEAGAGNIGEYTECSFSSTGIGTFKGSSNSNPVLGKKGKFEAFNESKLEVVAERWNINRVIDALIKSHPYEEPAYDIYPLKNLSTNYGYGAFGELIKPLSETQFLKHISERLNCKGLRYTRGQSDKIKYVAVCGGSGSDLLQNALNLKADAFVTADIKYHGFQDAENKILFVDAGHYETEIGSLDFLKTKLLKFSKQNGKKLKVYKYRGTTNPVKFFNNKGVN